MRAAIVVVTLLAALLGAGCSDRDAARRIDRLEQQVAELHAERAERNQKFDKRMAYLDEFAKQLAAEARDSTKRVEREASAIDPAWRTEMQIEVAAQFEVFARTNLNKPGQLAARPAQAARPDAAKRGVPAGVYDQIAAEAARKWPGNFEMQEYTIGNQIEAYQKLQGAR